MGYDILVSALLLRFAFACARRLRSMPFGWKGGGNGLNERASLGAAWLDGKRGHGEKFSLATCVDFSNSLVQKGRIALCQCMHDLEETGEALLLDSRTSRTFR